MSSKRFQDALKKIPIEAKRYSRNSLDFIDKFHSELDNKNLTIKDAAKILECEIDELRVMVSPLYDITLSQISYIEGKLDIKLINIKNE